MVKDRQLELLGCQIRRLRESNGLTQDQAAFSADLSRSYYGGVERGARNISSTNLIRIAKALDVQVGDLFPDISDL